MNNKKFFNEVFSNPQDYQTRDGKSIDAQIMPLTGELLARGIFHEKSKKPIRLAVLFLQQNDLVKRGIESVQCEVSYNSNGTFRDDGTQSNLDIIKVN